MELTIVSNGSEMAEVNRILEDYHSEGKDFGDEKLYPRKKWLLYSTVMGSEDVPYVLVDNSRGNCMVSKFETIDGAMLFATEEYSMEDAVSDHDYSGAMKDMGGWDVARAIEVVVEFIKRRFPEDSHWTDGNCYYFALILKDRFEDGIILYDVIEGHFVFQRHGVKFDWRGVVDESGEHNYVEWDKFNEYDHEQYCRVANDCRR